MAKEKIAILGGGLGSVSTAFWLTNQPGWQDRYEITVYQIGWRLGGKGAAGRGTNGEIQEHGLHIWIGFYDNAFRMIQAVYEELGRPPDAPLSTWVKAFTPHSYVVIAEKWKEEWKNWPVDFPTNPRVPGDVGEFLDIWDYLFEGLQLLVGHIREHVTCYELQDHPDVQHTWLADLGARLGHTIEKIESCALEDCLRVLMDLSSFFRTHQVPGVQADVSRLKHVLSHVQQWFHAREPDLLDNDELRRLYIIADLGLGMALGILEDILGNEVNGFDEIDRYDFREWLSKYGCSDVAVWSAPIQALYDLVFGYENGEISKPNFGAGAALLSTLKIGLDYKGAIFWKMNAGMGDTIFAPIYLVLKKRGVKFEFFSEVQNLGLSADKSRIETITIGRQATLRDEYQPFMDVKDLPCWPSAPLYEQLVEGQELKACGANIESFWTPWKNVRTETLRVGEQFDQVVLGISIGSLPYICSELLAANDRWRAMCENVGTVRTMSMQWWLTPELHELGWKLPVPVMDAYVEPMNTWADMSFLLPRERWKGPVQPKNIAYFCGAMVGGIPNRGESGFPAEALAEVKAIGLDFANNDVGFLWPKATGPINPNGLDFSKLCGDFDGQYFRANIDPSERYVLSLKGSVSSRIKPNESGFSNLFLTGDWTYNYFNAGCVEATVISGMLCSNAVCGYPPISAIEGVRPGRIAG